MVHSSKAQEASVTLSYKMTSRTPTASQYNHETNLCLFFFFQKKTKKKESIKEQKQRNHIQSMVHSSKAQRDWSDIETFKIQQITLTPMTKLTFVHFSFGRKTKKKESKNKRPRNRIESMLHTSPSASSISRVPAESPCTSSISRPAHKPQVKHQTPALHLSSPIIESRLLQLKIWGPASSSSPLFHPQISEVTNSP